MLLQLDKSDFILAMIEEVEVHEDRIHWTPIKNSEVNNKHKNKDGKLKTIYPFGISIARYSHMEDKQNKKPGYVIMEECNSVELTTGKFILQW